MDRSVLKHICKSKEEKLVLSPESTKRLEELQAKHSKLTNESNMEDAPSEKTPQKDMSAEISVSGQPVQQPANTTTISINFVSNQLAGLDTKSNKKGAMNSKEHAMGASGASTKQHTLDLSDYRVTTDKVAQMLLKVLE